MKPVFALFIAFILFSAPAFADARNSPFSENRTAVKQADLPAIAQVEVLKSERKMFLFDKDGNIVRTYDISLGRNPVGAKEQEGDSRTPEGNYKISLRNGKSGYYRSLKISYPEKKDIEHAKKLGVRPGGDIFIHGKPNMKFWMFWRYNKTRDWTDGCIALDDKDMMEMWSLIKGETPISIKP
jgi:murein L,D-transpeptidase YafK